MSNLDIAIMMACKAHAGQLDKAGEPYILHPLRVMMQFRDDAARTVGVLHDVVEDTSISLDDLRRAGFSEDIVSAIDCLSKKSGESYEEFISRVASNGLSRKVKIADLRDNLDVSRLPSVSEGDLARVEKYHDALFTLLTIENVD